jgi:hypothetical protein
MRTPLTDTDSQAERVQIDLLRKATVSQRTAIAFSLSETVIRLARRAIRQQNPKMPDSEVMLRFVAIHYGDELSEKLRLNLGQQTT